MQELNETQEQNRVGLTVQREARCTNDLLWFNAKKHMKFNSGGRMLCKCGKGFACEDANKPSFTKCSICYRQGLTRRELKALGLERP